MALSHDCVTFRDRQVALTQRWVIWGALGATSLHLVGLPWLGLLLQPESPLSAAVRMQVMVTPLPPEPELPDPLSTPANLAATASHQRPTAAMAEGSMASSQPMPPNSGSVPGNLKAPIPMPVALAAPQDTLPAEAVSEFSSATQAAETEPETLPESSAIAESMAVRSTDSEPDPLPTSPNPFEAATDSSAEAHDRSTEVSSETHPLTPDLPAPMSPLTGLNPALGVDMRNAQPTGTLADALGRLLAPAGIQGVGSASGDSEALPSGAIAPQPGGSSSGTGSEIEATAAGTGAGGRSGSATRTVSCRQCSRPDYPETALEAGVEGQPVVTVEFDAAGNVVGVTLQQSSGNAVLDQAALASVRNWQFETGGQGGEVAVEIPFVIEGSERHRAAQQRGDRESVTLPTPATAAEPTPAQQTATEPAVPSLTPGNPAAFSPERLPDVSSPDANSGQGSDSEQGEDEALTVPAATEAVVPAASTPTEPASIEPSGSQAPEATQPEVAPSAPAPPAPEPAAAPVTPPATSPEPETLPASEPAPPSETESDAENE